MKTGAIGSKVKQLRDTTVTDTTTPSLAKEIRCLATVDIDRASSNRKIRKN